MNDLTPVILITAMLMVEEGMITEEQAREMIKKESPCRGQ